MTEDSLHFPFFQTADHMRRAIQLDAEDTAEAEALERAEMVRIAAEAERAAVTAAEDAAEAFAQSEPPELPPTLTNGLSPMRARLVRYIAWVEQLQADHDSAVAGRTAYLTAQKVPTLTTAAINQLIKEDRSGLIALMTSGGKLVSKHALRTQERALLAEKLASDQHQAEIATEALIEVEARIDALEKQAQTVRSRRDAFVADALQEHLLATAGANMVAKADILRTSAMVTLGAFGALQALRGISHYPRPHQMTLPTPKLPGDTWTTGSADKPGFVTSGAGFVLDFPVHEQQAEQRRWLAKAARLRDDPLASLEDVT